jgi:phosphate/sulfate permease
MIFDSEIIGAIIGAIVAIALYWTSQRFVSQSKKEKREDEIRETTETRMLAVERKLDRLLDANDKLIEHDTELRNIKDNCYIVHNDYNSRFNKLTSRGDMAARDIDRLLAEISAMSGAITELKDSNIKLAGRVDKLLALSEQRDKEQDRKIETLFKKLEKEK